MPVEPPPQSPPHGERVPPPGRPRVGRFARAGAGVGGALLLLLGAAAAPAVPLHFPGQVSVPVFNQATAVAAWDAQGDGRSELIVGCSTGQVILVRDVGRGRYVAVDFFNLEGRVHALAVGRPVPGGEVRLLALTHAPNRLVLLSLALLPPAFAVLDEVPLEEEPGGVAFGQLGLAGGPGIAITLPGIDTWVLMEPGPGGWRQVAEIPAGDQPARIAAADLDGDGAPELVTADRGVLSRGLSVFAREVGGWQVRQQYATRGTPSDLVIWDRDRDLQPEIYVSHADSAIAAVLSTAGGRLTELAAVPLPQPTDGLIVGEMLVGQPGLLTWSSRQGTVHFLRWVEREWLFSETFYGGGEAMSGVLLELNGDAARDLALANGQAGSVGLLFGNRNPSFRAYQAEAVGLLPSAALLRDENGDGHADLLVSCPGSLTIERLFGNGRGRFLRDPAPIRLEAGPQAIVGLDADEDGLQDLAVLEPVAHRVRILRRLPEGGYQTLTTVRTGDGPVALVTADFDGDGHQDLAVGSQIQVRITVAFGNGEGGFPDILIVPLGLSRLLDLAALDFGGGPLPDLVVSGGATDVRTLVNLEDRSFGQAGQVVVPGGPAAFAVGDLNGDGRPDLAVGLEDENAIRFLYNQPAGGLKLQPQRVSLASRPGKMVCADVDLVSGPDLVIALPDQRALGISISLGPWEYSPALIFPSALGPSGVLVGDLNEDGLPDLAVLDRTLGLALSMLNIEPDPVPVVGALLAAEAAEGEIRLVVRAGEPPRWQLEGRGAWAWRPLAEQGNALFGRVAPATDGWLLVLGRDDLLAAGMSPDVSGAWSFRLLAGTGEVLAEAAAILPAAERPPLVAIGPARPNPFNPRVEVTVGLARPAVIEAAVWDLAGRRVATLAGGWHPAGDHVLAWDGRRDGRPAAAGGYLLTVIAEGRRHSRKLTLLK